jgi:hypothetical protein
VLADLARARARTFRNAGFKEKPGLAMGRGGDVGLILLRPEPGYGRRGDKVQLIRARGTKAHGFDKSNY